MSSFNKPNLAKHVHTWARIRPTSNFAASNLELIPNDDPKRINVHLKRDPKKGVVNNKILDWSFDLDGVFHNTSQEDVYNMTAKNVVSDAVKGYNGTLLCYGQTGAGKTFTISGVTETFPNRGIIPRALSQLYRDIQNNDDYAMTVRISYLEIYNETMFDLLSTLPNSWNSVPPEHLTIVENDGGVYVKGLSCHLAQTEEDALNLLFEGETNRIIEAHALNQNSSRSHCVFTVYVESRCRTLSQAKYTVSKLNFVDLAGSERIGKTNSAGKIQMEAMYINKSLTFLEQVVIALAERHRDHIPFRQSKLTHYLRDSIGGMSNTILIANIWGELEQIEETISTLKFATRMMCVNAQPCVNEVYDPVLMAKQLEREIIHLKAELAMQNTLTNRAQIQYEELSDQQRTDIKNQVRKYLDGGLDEIDMISIRQINGVFEAFKDFYLNLEQMIEDRFREKYTLIDRTDPEAIVAAQKAGYNIDDEGRLVGEVDGSSFGVGVAPKTSSRKEYGSVVSARRRQREKASAKATEKGKASGSPLLAISAKSHPERSKSPVTPMPEKKDDKEKVEEKPTPIPVTSPRASDVKEIKDEQHRPCTPPNKAVAFEEFKQERGSEINRVLLENKEILIEKKRFYTSLAHQINDCKRSIDYSKSSLEALTRNRENDGITYTDDGEVVIGEQEFDELKRLKDLKRQYRHDYERLQQTKVEVSYCQKLADQCRLRLIQEFDTWYSLSFLPSDVTSAEDETIARKPGVLIPSDSKFQYEDELEKLRRLQRELLAENPDSAPFYAAQISTQQRKAYEINMLQPQNKGKQPRTPPSVVRTRPPTMLPVHP